MLYKINKYLSGILLFAFAWVITPTQTIHDLFADHIDTEDNYCQKYHSHLGTHIEETHVHCEILKLNTPVYSVPQLVSLNCSVQFIETPLLLLIPELPITDQFGDLPARAPPVV